MTQEVIQITLSKKSQKNPKHEKAFLSLQEKLQLCLWCGYKQELKMCGLCKLKQENESK